MKTPAWLPPTANPLTPYLTVADAQKALEFYRRAFGFTPGDTPMRDDKGRIVHAELTYEGRSIAMCAPEGAWGGTDRTPKHTGVRLPLNFYVYCADVDRVAANAKAAGATIERPPEDMFWGDRTTMIADPDGYLWMFATHKHDFDPAKAPNA
ncbi:MAG: glyoxalase/bleomycin resistance/extradiol dioxygenase family protein [Burkholderiales bacterium]|nr:glyoxalase/bleomycin resistance/extradiol dioxygenase family protein [Burkholderiales bacterium]